MNSWPPGASTRAAAARNRPRSKWCTQLNAVTTSRLAARNGSCSAAASSGTTLKAWPRLAALSWASMAAETSLAASSEPSGSRARSSRVYRPVPQPSPAWRPWWRRLRRHHDASAPYGYGGLHSLVDEAVEAVAAGPCEPHRERVGTCHARVGEDTAGQETVAVGGVGQRDRRAWRLAGQCAD